MAIKETELVTLNGDVNAFGGRIYNANYQIGFSQSPSSIKLSIVNESGDYNISEEDLDIDGSPDTINFGARSVKMYPIEYSIDKSSGGKILTVEYQDSSIIYLDKKFVVLNGTHIASKSNSPDRPLITVGDKYYSEEIEDENGNIVVNRTLTPPNDVDLGQSLYYVSELFYTMRSIGIPMHSSVGNVLLNKDGATDYLRNTVGSLRSVLSSWGGEMAFSFYWGEDNKLHFVDLEKGIEAKTEKLKEVIPFSNEESYSLKGTVSRGYSLYYGKEGNFYTEELPPHKASFFFRRGYQSTSEDPPKLDSDNVNLSLIKAALAGESFFNGYVIYLASENDNFKGYFGIKDPEQVSEEQRKYIDPDDTYSNEDSTGEYYFIKYTPEDSKFNYGFYISLGEQLMTYEIAMSEKDYNKYTSYDYPFQYDENDETTFISDSNGSISKSKHRAYFSLSPAEAFNLDEVSIPSDPYIPVDFSDASQAKNEDLDPSEITVAGLRKGVDWGGLVGAIDYRTDVRKRTVRGYKPRPAGSSIFPKIEKIALTRPTSEGVLSVDMQIDSTDDNEVSLAGSFEEIASILNESYTQNKKAFRKTFSVTGIDLPEKIEIEDGLQSMSISNTNDKGTTTSYTVGNTFFALPSKDIVLQKLERERFAYLKNNPNVTFVFNRGGFNV